MVALSTRVLTAESSPNRRREFPIIRLYTPTSRSGQVRITHPIYIPEIDKWGYGLYNKRQVPPGMHSAYDN